MNELRLYIDGKEADLDTNTRLDNVIVITKDYENVSDPTAIKWDYTKTVSLPATDRNNALFEHIWNFGQGIIGFNPAKRVPFFMTYNGAVIPSGYFKMNNVSYKGQYPYQYKCTLYGSLGDFFNALGDKDMDELRVDDDLFTHTIRQDAVRDSWPNEYYKYILSYSGFYDNFASDRVIITAEVTTSIFSNIIQAFGDFYAVTNTVGRSILYKSTDNGVSFTLQETNLEFPPKYLAYNNNLMVGITNNYIYESEDGASFTQVFNDSSVNLVSCEYARSRFIAVGSMTYQGRFYGCYTSKDSNGSWTSIRRVDGSSNFIDVCGAPDSSTGGTAFLLLGELGDTTFWTTNFTSYTPVNISANIVLKSCAATSSYTVIVGSQGNIFYTVGSSSNFNRVDLSPASLNKIRAFDTRFVIVGDNGKVLTGTSPVSLSDVSVKVDFELNLTDVAYYNGRYIVVGDNAYAYTDNITSGNWTVIRGEPQDENEEGKEVDEHQRNEFRSYYQRPVIRLKYLIEQIISDAKEDTGYDVILDETFFNENNPYWWDTWVTMDRLQSYDEDHDGNIRSGDEITFQIMMKKGVSQLSFLTDYTRMFGLKYRIDPIEKKVYIMTRNTFFEGYKIEDWSQKMDYNTAVELDVNPIEEKNWLLRWQDAGTYYEEKYNKKYGIDFGAKEIDTGYEFNTNTKEWMEGNIYTNAIISREHDVYFTDRGGDYWDDKILPAFFVKSNDKRDNTEVNMSLLFFDGMRQTAKPFRITDDTTEAQQYNLYCWQDVDEGLVLSEYPFMTRLIEKNGSVYSLDIEKPNGYNYPITADQYPQYSTIYNRFWKPYIDERINEDRRRMTAKFYLTPLDVAGFDFNKFITVNDTLWHVEKINNYSMTSERSTEVVLYRVNDMEAYTHGQVPVGIPTRTLTIITSLN